MVTNLFFSSRLCVVRLNRKREREREKERERERERGERKRGEWLCSCAETANKLLFISSH